MPPLTSDFAIMPSAIEVAHQQFIVLITLSAPLYAPAFLFMRHKICAILRAIFQDYAPSA
jgi:hypothetical protein